MARCPNCTEALHRSAAGDYPAQCPKCGVKLRSKSKRPAAVAAPAAPAAATGQERVVRSFSTKRNAADPFAQEPFAEAAEIEEPAEDLPFAVSKDEAASAADFVSTPFPETADNPFAPVATVASTPPETAKLELNPFGDVVVPPPPKSTNTAAIVKWSIIGVMAAGAMGVGVYFGKDLLAKPTPKERPGYHNPTRFYVFYALPSPWKEDKARAARAHFDLALHRADVGAWVTLRTEPVKDEVIDPKEVSDLAVEKWKERFPDFVPSATLGRAKLAKQDAVVVEGEGTIKDVPIRGRTLILIAGGVKYQLGLEAPVAEWDQLERDFSLARDSLELTGGAVAPIQTLGEKDVTVFASKKFPYRVSAPATTWREVPELLTDSRFDDVKLQDKARLGEVVIAARETKDLPGMRVRYVETQNKRYENKIRELESSIEKLVVRGRKAMRTILIVSNSGGDFMLYTTFIEGDGLVFQIQARAPVDKRDFYEPLFARIVDSFEVLDKAPEQPKKEEPTPPPAKVEPPKMEAKAPAATEPMKKADPPKVESPKAEPPMKAPEKKSEEAAKPKEPMKKDAPKDDAKKPDAPKKKKSLDDLD